jgi:hypothetical protein
MRLIYEACLHLLEASVFERGGEEGNGVVHLVLWDTNRDVIKRHDGMYM